MEPVEWEITVTLNNPRDRKWLGISDLGKYVFKIECSNDWQVWEAYHQANHQLLNRFGWPHFLIESVYCPSSNKGWRYFKIDCESFSK